MFARFVAEKCGNPMSRHDRRNRRVRAAFWLGPEHNRGLAIDRGGVAVTCDYKSGAESGGRMTSVSPMSVFARTRAPARSSITA
jgi:hypothetical protein